MIEIAEYKSPAGPMHLAVRDGRLCALTFDEWSPRSARVLEGSSGTPLGDGISAEDVVKQLQRYFEGSLDVLLSIPVELAGTPFQRRVWSALRDIPPGETASYREIALAVGSPNAVRAVGSANGANPVGVVVPCHRVIRSGGDIGGYGGGVDRKRWLLEHERRWSQAGVS